MGTPDRVAPRRAEADEGVAAHQRGRLRGRRHATRRGGAPFALVALAAALGGCLPGRSSAPTIATTTTEMPIPPTPSTRVRPGLATPDAAARELWDAWRDGDRDRAVGFTPAKLVDGLFADRWSPQYVNEGCAADAGAVGPAGPAVAEAATVAVDTATATTAGPATTRAGRAGRAAATRRAGRASSTTVTDSADPAAVDPAAVDGITAEPADAGLDAASPTTRPRPSAERVSTTPCGFRTPAGGYTVRVTGAPSAGYRVTGVVRGAPALAGVDSPATDGVSDLSGVDGVSDIANADAADSTLPGTGADGALTDAATSTATSRPRARKRSATATTVRRRSRSAATAPAVPDAPPAPAAPAPAPAAESPAAPSGKVEVGGRPVEAVDAG